MRVLVTGATGFIGRYLCDAFIQSGLNAVGVVRKAVNVGAGSCVEVGNIGSTTRWDAVLQKGDCVVHLAARAHVMEREPAAAAAIYEEVNSLGAAHLARRAAAAGVRRLVFLSSIKVNGEVTHAVPFCSDDVSAPVDVYGLSKWHAEQELRKISQETGLETVIIRVPLVYGPGVKGNFLRLLRLLRIGVPLPLGAVTNRRSLIYVGNLTDFIARCLDAASAVGKTFLVSDTEDLSTPDLLRRLAAAMGRSPRLVSVPVGVLHRLAGYVGLRAEIDRLTGSLVVDASHARTTLGWVPPFSVNDGLADTVRWFQTQYRR